MDLGLNLSLDLNLKLKLSSNEDVGLGAEEFDIGADVESEHEELPLLTAPRTTNAELQRTMDAVAERLNGLVKAQVSTSPVLPAAPLGHRRATNRTVSRPAREDKENQSVSEGWSYVGADEYQGGLGLGVDAVDPKLGKEMGNVVVLSDNTADSKGRKDKERKGKRESFSTVVFSN